MQKQITTLYVNFTNTVFFHEPLTRIKGRHTGLEAVGRLQHPGPTQGMVGEHVGWEWRQGCLQ